MPTLVIGDIHGCYLELLALLEKSGLGKVDSIVAVGDIVDRGPETPQLLDFFREVSPEENIKDAPFLRQSLMGNHERKHVRAARHEVKLSISQHISRQQLGEAYSEAVAWMSALPLYVELPEATILHGYLEPNIPLEQQNPSVLCGTMGGERLLRQRYPQPWYELYDGQKPVIVGHYNYDHTAQPFVYRDRIFGLDTDCVHGKALTGLLLPAFQLISVPSRGNLWMQVRRSYQPPQTKKAPPAVSWSEQDDLALHSLVEKARQANAQLLERLQASDGYSELTARQQARLYAAQAGSGLFATLMQLARLGKLDVGAARKILKQPANVRKLL